MMYPIARTQFSDALNLRVVKRLLEEEVPQAIILKVLAVIEETAVEVEQQNRELDILLKPTIKSWSEQ